MAKKQLPQKLNLCLVSRKFPVPDKTAYGFLWPIAKGVAQKGHEVTVLTTSSPNHVPEVTADGVRILYLHENQPYVDPIRFHRTAKKHFSELHREKPFHLVHSLDDSGKTIAQYKKDFNISVAFDIEATQIAQLFSILGMAQETAGGLLKTSIALAYKFLRTYFGADRRLLKSADGIFVTSPRQRIILERYYLYPDAKMFTVPWAIDVGDLSTRQAPAFLRESLGLPKDARTIVTVSDMAEINEMRNLLRAFVDVAVKFSNARLIILGNGPRRKDIEFEALNLALGNRVVMPGAVSESDLSDYTALADVYVNLSSRSTGLEPAMILAMAQRKVIVGSEVSAMSTVVEDGLDGYLLRPADITALSRLLVQLFSGQLPASEIGERARRKVVDLLNVEKMVDETINAYFKILKQTKRY